MSRTLTEPSVWPMLRPGLCSDLGFSSVDALCEYVRFPDALHAKAAFDRTTAPNDELMVSLLRAWPTVPVLYFVQLKGEESV